VKCSAEHAATPYLAFTLATSPNHGSMIDGLLQRILR
jgi:hypothetical protein